MFNYRSILFISCFLCVFSHAEEQTTQQLNEVASDVSPLNCIYRVNRHFCLGQLWSSNLKFELQKSVGDIDIYKITQDEDELPLFAIMTISVQYDNIMKIKFNENKSWLPIKSGIKIDEVRAHYISQIPEKNWITSNRFERWATIGKIRVTLENRTNGDVTIELKKEWQPELF